MLTAKCPEKTKEPFCAFENSKAAFQQEEAFWSARPGVCFGTSSGTPPLAEGPPKVAAYLGAGGHGDVQVAENVLGVLVLHRLAQK